MDEIIKLTSKTFRLVCRNLTQLLSAPCSYYSVDIQQCEASYQETAPNNRASCTVGRSNVFGIFSLAGQTWGCMAAPVSLWRLTSGSNSPSCCSLASPCSSIPENSLRFSFSDDLFFSSFSFWFSFLLIFFRVIFSAFLSCILQSLKLWLLSFLREPFFLLLFRQC